MSQQIWNTSRRNSQSSLLIDLIQSSYVNVGSYRIWKNVLNNKNAEPILTGCSSDISYSLPLTISVVQLSFLISSNTTSFESANYAQ